MASHSVSDDSRWETITMVRPCAMCFRLALTSASLSGIERAGRFVQDQDAGIVDQGAGDRQPLALAAGEVGRALLDHRFVAVRQTLDELGGACQPGGVHRVGQGQAGTAGQDVFRDGAAEQEVFLQHDAKVATQMAPD